MVRIAGILNITPDSFYSGARYGDTDAIRTAALRMKAEGAGMIDVGACSTRPGSTPVSGQEEISRLSYGMPVISEACPSMPLSVDTFRPSVAEFCIRNWHIAYINDVSGGCGEMYRIAGESHTGYILTYNQPVSDHDNVVVEMTEFFADRLEKLQKAGVGDIILDPGFGFAKDMDQNYLVLAGLDRLKRFGLPVMAGLSRKSMACRLLGITPEESLEATVSLNTLALAGGADWLRVHDVRAAVQTATITEKYMNAIRD